jgi:hypothetical protein
LGTEPGVENNTQVYIDGVYQQKNTIHGIWYDSVQFSVAPPNLSTIEVMVITAQPINTANAASVSFTQVGSTDTRTVQAKLQESVSVLDFGAVGDGVTDDTAAIQAACNAAFRVYFPSGTYIISTPIQVNKTGFKAFGSSEGSTAIKASTGFVGIAMFDLGDGAVSKYFNEIRNLSFIGSSVADLIGIYLNRVNNQSKIMHCHFDLFNGGTNSAAIKAVNLALANICLYNKFVSNKWDIWLDNVAGNSWTIGMNYFTGGGRVYFENSMTDVKYINNVSDNGSRIYADGVSGQRGMHITGNRFETALFDHIPIKMGVIRGCFISDNYFTGSGLARSAIELSSTFVEQYVTIANNFFENYVQSYVISSVPSNRLELYGNHANDDHTVTGPEYDTNTTLTIGSDEINFGPNKESLFILSKSLTGGGSTDNVLTITTDGTRGCYTIIADIMVSNTPNSAAVAAGHARFSWTHITDNGGNSDDSAVTTEKALVAIADAGGSRDITGLTAAVTTTSGTVSTFSLTCSTVGAATDVQAHCSIKMIYHQYSAQPAVAVV